MRGCRHTMRFLVLAAAAFFSGHASAAHGEMELGISFPPMDGAAARALVDEQFEALGIRLVRFSVHWGSIETQRGRYDWSTFDQRMSWIAENDYSLLLTVRSHGPEWAVSQASQRGASIQDEEAFTSFVRALLERHSDKVAKIQFGNEWSSEMWYPASAEDYVRQNNAFYQLVKEVSPQLPVVLGGIQRVALAGLAVMDGRIGSVRLAGGKSVSEKTPRIQSQIAETRHRLDHVLEHAHYDAVDLHLYFDPENWGHYVDVIRDRVSDKPILVSEFGAPNVKWVDRGGLTEEVHAEALRTSLETLARAEVQEAYLFRLVQKFPGPAYGDHPTGASGLLDTGHRRLLAWDVFRSFAQRSARSPAR